MVLWFGIPQLILILRQPSGGMESHDRDAITARATCVNNPPPPLILLGFKGWQTEPGRSGRIRTRPVVGSYGTALTGDSRGFENCSGVDDPLALSRIYYTNAVLCIISVCCLIHVRVAALRM